MKASHVLLPALGGLLVLGSLGGSPAPAKADTTSTALIVAGAASIVGALLYDANNHPYYVRNNHRYYVTQSEAQYYQGHHQGNYRRAYVPENEYPVARDPYHDNNGGYNGNHH
jgi:hypothetical protein